MDEINRVARMMVDAEPAVDLAARIRARLDQVQPVRRTSSWWLWRVAAPVGAVAGLALIVGVLGSRGPGVVGVRGPEAEARVGVQGSRGPGVESRVEVQGSRSPVVQAVSGGSPQRVLQRASVSALSMEESAWMERRIAALPPVEALSVDQLTYASIQPEALSITPLFVTAMRTDGADITRQDNR